MTEHMITQGAAVNVDALRGCETRVLGLCDRFAKHLGFIRCDYALG